jgi:hypothetical protein
MNNRLSSLAVGTMITIFRISEYLAHTQRIAGEFVAVAQTKRSGRDCDVLCFIPNGKRGKVLTVYLDDTVIGVVGNAAGVNADSEYSQWSCNACFNLVAFSKHDLHNTLQRAFTDLTDDMRAKIIYTPRHAYTDNPNAVESYAQLLYPELNTNHAVVNRMKEAEMMRGTNNAA